MAEWYRNTDWNDEIEAQFFDKLSRARSQRDQYLAIQAMLLAESRPEVTLRLVDLYFDTRTDTFNDGRARQAASQARFAMGGYEQALDDFQAALEGQEASGLYTVSPLQFAFLAAQHRSTRHYDAAIAQLSTMSPPGKGIPELVYRYHAATALLLSETGRDPAGALRAAETALDLPDPVLEFFRDITWRLRGIARR